LAVLYVLVLGFRERCQDALEDEDEAVIQRTPLRLEDELENLQSTDLNDLFLAR